MRSAFRSVTPDLIPEALRPTNPVTPGLTRGPTSFCQRLTPPRLRSRAAAQQSRKHSLRLSEAGQELVKGLLIVPGALITSIACLMVLAELVKGATP